MARPTQEFAEYSLWNDSAYSIFSVRGYNRIEFTRPAAGSIFLDPDDSADMDERDKDSGDETEAEVTAPELRMFTSLGFQRYMVKAVKVMTREDILRDPALYQSELDSDDVVMGMDQARINELCSHPPPLRWLTAQQVHGRGRKRNDMQRRLEMALTLPARMGQGGGVIARMGLESGLCPPVGRGAEPDPYCVRMLNAAYAHTNAGLGLPEDSDADSSDTESVVMCSRAHRLLAKKLKKQVLIQNVLTCIRDFVKNDLQVEMFFETTLEPYERKYIHQIVAKLRGEPSEITFDRIEMVQLLDDIELRNNYNLFTMSQGISPLRQICIYKEATTPMFLLTPDDLRYAQPDEDYNPFMRSIVKPSLHDEPPEQYTMLDRVIDFFIEFTDDPNYIEFRFLGAFSCAEIDVISTFFGMVLCITEKRPYLDLPERLVKNFEKGIYFITRDDANGFVSSRKVSKEEAEAEIERKLKKKLEEAKRELKQEESDTIQQLLFH